MSGIGLGSWTRWPSVYCQRVQFGHPGGRTGVGPYWASQSQQFCKMESPWVPSCSLRYDPPYSPGQMPVTDWTCETKSLASWSDMVEPALFDSKSRIRIVCAVG